MQRRGVDAELLFENCACLLHDQAVKLSQIHCLVSFDANAQRDNAPPQTHYAVRVATWCVVLHRKVCYWQINNVVKCNLVKMNYTQTVDVTLKKNEWSNVNRCDLQKIGGKDKSPLLQKLKQAKRKKEKKT